MLAESGYFESLAMPKGALHVMSTANFLPPYNGLRKRPCASLPLENREFCRVSRVASRDSNLIVVMLGFLDVLPPRLEASLDLLAFWKLDECCLFLLSELEQQFMDDERIVGRVALGVRPGLVCEVVDGSECLRDLVVKP
jgi:hypothetical protein